MPTLVASQERTLVGGTYTFKSTQNLDLIDAAGIHAQQHRMTPLPEDAKEKRRWWDELGWRDRLVERLIAAKGVVRSQKDLGPSMDTVRQETRSAEQVKCGRRFQPTQIDRPKSFSLDSIFNGQMVEEAGVIAGSDRYREIVALAQLPGYGISRAAQCWERGVQTFDARKDEIGSNRRRRGQEDHDEEVEIEDAQLRWIEDPSIPIEKADLAAALIQLWCNKFLDGDQKVYQAGSIGRRRSDSQDVDLVVSKDVWTREDVDQFKSKIEADQTLLGPVYRHKRAAPFKMGAIPLNNPFIGEGSDLLKIAVELEGRRYMFDLFLVETGSLPTTLFYLRSGFVVHPTGMYTFGEWEKGADEAEKIVVKEEHEIWARLGIAYQDTEDRSVDASKDGLPWNGGRKLETRGRTVKGSSGSLQGGAKRGKGTKKGAKRVIEDVAVETRYLAQLVLSKLVASVPTPRSLASLSPGASPSASSSRRDLKSPSILVHSPFPRFVKTLDRTLVQASERFLSKHHLAQAAFDPEKGHFD
ncbi:hypothetical protein JCM10212_004895 [Sporobolomyces blumeae]